MIKESGSRVESAAARLILVRPWYEKLLSK
jgi:hypothetical protein